MAATYIWTKKMYAAFDLLPDAPRPHIDVLESLHEALNQASIREVVGYRWRFEDQPDKWHVQKKIPHWYSSFMTDIVLQPLYAE